MAQITLQSFSIQPTVSGYSSTNTVLRVWYNQSFIDSAGTSVQGGTGQTGFYVSAPCTITNNAITIPTFTFWTTVDAQDPNPQSIRCFAQLFSNGAPKQTVFVQNGTSGPGWIVYNPSPLTFWLFTQLAFLNQTSVVANPPVNYVKTTDMVSYVNSFAPAPATDSKALSAGQQASIADSKAVSDSVLTSTAQSGVVSNSLNTSVAQSGVTSNSLNTSVAQSGVTSNSLNISKADSKGTSAGLGASVADSKAVSDSILTSTADSKGVSSGQAASIADSKGVSNSINISVADSKGVSDSVVISSLTSRVSSKGG